MAFISWILKISGKEKQKPVNRESPGTIARHLQSCFLESKTNFHSVANDKGGNGPDPEKS
jgi:hypothetical protein